MKKAFLFCLLSVLSLQSYSTTHWVGTGSGDLTIDGTTGYTSGDVIIVKSGTYGTIMFQNFSVHVTAYNDSAGAVICDGLSGTGTPDIYAGVNIDNCKYLHLTRNPTTSLTIPYGFINQNNSYRPTGIDDQNSYDTLQYFVWNNIGDNVINFNGTVLKWDSTDATVQGMYLSILNSLFENSNGTIIAGGQGYVDTTGVYGLQRGFEIGYCTFTGIDDGDLVFMGASDKYNIHDNICTEINRTNNDDNGLFHMIGNGNFYRNYFYHYQGHVLRMWTLSFGPPEKDSVWANITDSSRRYSPFEYQSTLGSNVIAGPHTNRIDTIFIVNNTIGNVNYEHNYNFNGCLVDNYSLPTSSIVVAWNNVLYNAIDTPQSPGGKIFQFGLSAQTDTLKDWYYTNAASAGWSESLLYPVTGSPLINAGTSGYLIGKNDYHGTAFSTSTPSIGAVQNTLVLPTSLYPSYDTLKTFVNPSTGDSTDLIPNTRWIKQREYLTLPQVTLQNALTNNPVATVSSIPIINTSSGVGFLVKGTTTSVTPEIAIENSIGNSGWMEVLPSTITGGGLFAPNQTLLTGLYQVALASQDSIKFGNASTTNLYGGFTNSGKFFLNNAEIINTTATDAYAANLPSGSSSFIDYALKNDIGARGYFGIAGSTFSGNVSIPSSYTYLQGYYGLSLIAPGDSIIFGNSTSIYGVFNNSGNLYLNHLANSTSTNDSLLVVEGNEVVKQPRKLILPNMVYGSDVTAQTTGSSWGNYTVPSDGPHSYVVQTYLNVTALSVGTVKQVVDWTDENNNAREYSFTTISALGPSTYFPFGEIRCKAGSTILLSALTSGTITFDGGGSIIQTR